MSICGHREDRNVGPAWPRLRFTFFFIKDKLLSFFLQNGVGQRILTNFVVLYDAFLDASLFTVMAFLTMIRECMAVRARSFGASATTGHIWCPVYHNLQQGDRQVLGRHTGREASLPPHTCTPCSFGKHCWKSCTVGHTELLHFATSGRIPRFDPYSDCILYTINIRSLQLYCRDVCHTPGMF